MAIKRMSKAKSTEVMREEPVNVSCEQEVSECVEEAGELTDSEKEALQNTAPEPETDTISIHKVENVVNALAEKFNIDMKDYSITLFKVHGTKCSVSLSGEEIDISFVIKDAESYGIN